ncbi:hypothetical protein SLA2020_389690 [Shorea laevis]
MSNSKTFLLLGLVFAVVLLVSSEVSAVEEAKLDMEDMVEDMVVMEVEGMVEEDMVVSWRIRWRRIWWSWRYGGGGYGGGHGGDGYGGGGRGGYGGGHGGAAKTDQLKPTKIRQILRPMLCCMHG